MARSTLGKLLVLFILSLAPLAAQAGPAAVRPLILAVLPYLPAPQIQHRFGPLAEYLGRALGRPVQVRIGRDYDEHIAEIGEDRVDIAFLGPAAYVRLVAKYGRKPLLARFEVNGKPELFGVIAVRRDSPLQRLDGLKGKRFAFTDPLSTTGHYMPRYMLLKAGVPGGALGQHRFLGSHVNVALGVLAGDFDAGAMKLEVYREYAPQGLRALAVSPPTADYLFVSRADLPAGEFERLRLALLKLKDQTNGPALLNRLHPGLTALIPASDQDYDPLRVMMRAVESAKP